MKRIIVLLIAGLMLLSGCSGSVSREDMEDTTRRFTEALRVYDRDEMSSCLTQFPDNSAYVYLDDIFNDADYMELYRILFADITYTVKSYERNRAVIEYTMPNVQQLYSDVSAAVLSLAMTDETLTQKLAEDEQNGIVLIRELMIHYANAGQNIETMTQEFTLTFQRKDRKTVIVCDDALRALITGNFFLSKNITLESIQENAD